jgi:hypothetical protein
MSDGRKWGVQLLGHQFDLAEWADQLKQPFDPWVDQSGGEVVLRWSGFDNLETAREVYEKAAFIMDQLSGAMAAVHQTRPLRYEGVIEYRPDGSRHQTIIVGTGRVEARGRAAAVGVAIGPDGKELPPPPPQRSQVQQWVKQADENEHLSHALAHFARSTWYETYKTIECLEDWVGGESKLKALNWVTPRDFERLKRTANSFRHRAAGKHTPPPDSVTSEQAREMLAALIRAAFADAKTSEQP